MDSTCRQKKKEFCAMIDSSYKQNIEKSIPRIDLYSGETSTRQPVRLTFLIELSEVMTRVSYINSRNVFLLGRFQFVSMTRRVEIRVRVGAGSG